MATFYILFNSKDLIYSSFDKEIIEEACENIKRKEICEQVEEKEINQLNYYNECEITIVDVDYTEQQLLDGDYNFDEEVCCNNGNEFELYEIMKVFIDGKNGYDFCLKNKEDDQYEDGCDFCLENEKDNEYEDNITNQY